MMRARLHHRALGTHRTRSTRLVLLLLVLFTGACRAPNDDLTYNPYSRGAGRPWVKQVEDLPDIAETQIQRLDSRIEHILH